MRVMLPPAAPIFSAAEEEKACACTWTSMPPRSPVPSTLTGWPRRTAPASARASGLMDPPCGNSAAIRSRLTTWNATLFGFLKPESLGRRMYSGVCPPSNRAEVLPRAPVPLVPRPAVLPLEPSPRPTRVFGVWAPGAGRRWWTLRVMVCHPSTSSTVTRCGTVATMPRISGRSSCTTESWIRFSPRERSVSRWFFLRPIDDLTWVTLSCAISDPLTRTRTQHGGRGDVLEGQTAAGRDLLGADEVLQRLHRGVHDVDRVRGTQALREHVVDAGALEHGAHRTTGDDTGTGAGRLEQHDTGGRLTLHRVRDGAGDARHVVEVLLGLLDALGDGRGHLLGLAVADADLAVAVTDDHQGGEAEAPTALDDLGHAVDGDHALDVVALLGGSAPRAPPPVTTVAAGVSPPRAPPPALWCWPPTAPARRHDGRGGRYRRRRRRRVAVVLASDVPLDHASRAVRRHGHQKSSPPSRAPSASAAIRPA